jgi:hypothetical protein
MNHPRCTPWATAPLLLTAPWTCSPALADQEPARKTEPAAVAATRPTSGTVDPRFHSPRATVRTFLTAMNYIDDDRGQLDRAVACFDPAGLPPDPAQLGRYAFDLEILLRTIKTPTWIMPDSGAGTDYKLSEPPDLQVTLHRMADGRWVFSATTLEDLRRMRASLLIKAIEAPDAKDATDVPTALRSPRATWRTFAEHPHPLPRRLAPDDPQLRPDDTARYGLRRPPPPPLPHEDHPPLRHPPPSA